MPVKLEQAGVRRDQFGTIAETALGNGSLIFNPIEAEKDDILQILSAAY